MKKQLGKIKDNEIQTRLDLLRRRGNITNDNNNNNNNNNNNFPLYTQPSIPSDFPPDFPFNPHCCQILPISLPPPYSSSLPPFPPAQLTHSIPPFPIPPDRFTLSAPLFPDFKTTFAEKIVLADSDPKIGTIQEPRIILTPKVEEIPNAEGKMTISEPLNQLFPEAKKYLMMKKTDEEPKTEFLLSKYDEIMEELNKGNIPPQLDFFIGEQNFEFQNRVMQLGVEQDSKDFFTFLQTEICKQLLLRSKLKIHVETGNIYTTTKALTKTFTRN